MPSQMPTKPVLTPRMAIDWPRLPGKERRVGRKGDEADAEENGETARLQRLLLDAMRLVDQRRVRHAGGAPEVRRRPEKRDDRDQDRPGIGRPWEILVGNVAQHRVGERHHDVEGDRHHDEALDEPRHAIKDARRDGALAGQLCTHRETFAHLRGAVGNAGGLAEVQQPCTVHALPHQAEEKLDQDFAAPCALTVMPTTPFMTATSPVDLHAGVAAGDLAVFVQAVRKPSRYCSRVSATPVEWM